MLTIQALKDAGVNTDEGMARCLNNEAFYFRLIGMALNDPSYGELKAALDAGDTQKAFEECHKLKGMLGNLSLTPVYDPVAELTEILRNDADGDRTGLYERIAANRDALLALAKG